jgi:hypothetical protein
MGLMTCVTRGSLRAASVAIVLSAVATVGCAKRTTIETYPVTGKISVSGKPASYAKLTFWPVSESTDYMLSVSADQDGNFELLARKPPDGASMVKYDVTVSWRIPANPTAANDPDYGPELLPLKFRNPKTSGLSVEVESEADELKPIEIDNR